LNVILVSLINSPQNYDTTSQEWDYKTPDFWQSELE